jgi:prepilin-type processing-associated H-X9-DG protein
MTARITRRITIALILLLIFFIALAMTLPPALEHMNRWKCAKNLSAIGQIIMLYSNGHQHCFPPNLGTLALEEDATPAVFICPDSGTSAPENLPPDQLVDWVNAHSDYLYIGESIRDASSFDSKTNQETLAFEDKDDPGVRWDSAQSRRLVVAYEKEQDHGGTGMNVLFADGRVEWMTLDAAHDAIALTRAKIATAKKSTPPSTRP